MNLFDYYAPESIIALLGLVMEDKGTYFLGVCPFHMDTKPSFSIDKRGFFKCFSCSAKGNIHQLIRKLTGKSSRDFLHIDDYESFEFVASLSKKDRSKFPDYSTIKKEGDTVDCYSNKECTDYLTKRGINKEFVDFFNLSYAEYVIYNKTKFFNRLIIPLMQNGKLVGIEGRDVTGKQKPKVLYCKGSKVQSLFNYDNLDKSKEVIVVEGIIDTVKIWQEISKNVCSIFGVALARNQKTLLNEFPHLTIMPDGDTAGEGVLDELYETMDNEFKVALIEGKDPNDASIKELNEALKNKVSATSYFIVKEEVFEKKNYEWE